MGGIVGRADHGFEQGYFLAYKSYQSVNKFDIISWMCLESLVSIFGFIRISKNLKIGPALKTKPWFKKPNFRHYAVISLT